MGFVSRSWGAFDVAMKSYSGSCHCGAVTFDAEVDLDNTMVCNCSRCQRRGWVMTFTPGSSFHLKSGEANLTEYQFNKRQVRHLFCKTCGIEAFGKGERPKGALMVAVNVNCLEGVDPRALPFKAVDGRSF
jgi:hypothetical protein